MTNASNCAGMNATGTLNAAGTNTWVGTTGSQTCTIMILNLKCHNGVWTLTIKIQFDGFTWGTATATTVDCSPFQLQFDICCPGGNCVCCTRGTDCVTVVITT
jgi:hypothetical protein